MTTEQAINRIAERVYENTKNIKLKDRQRRYTVTDLYGIEYTRQGDSGSPATFYISISPDMVYLMRFEFKLIIQPFTAFSNGMETAAVDVNNRSLSVSGSSITPNPHDHTTQPHSHNLTHGIALVHTTASDFTVYIEGVDVTPYLMAQYGDWIDGEGVYPSLKIGEDYDILEVAGDLVAEGREEDAEKLVHPGYKKIEIRSNAPFQVTLVNYLKYNAVDR